MIKYRPEVDGLRAVAVASVLLFHSENHLFRNGYLGVDIFIVLSGYLISSRVRSDISNQKFSLSDFYQRRMRRIVPALFLMLALSIPAAWVTLSANSYSNFSKTLVSSVLFSSNLLFWQNTDYFNAVVNENPLLHTWSLGLEEQFYFIFPLILMIIFRYGRRAEFICFSALSVFSLSLAFAVVAEHSKFAFYLLLTRFWELMFGYAVAVILQSKSKSTFLKPQQRAQITLLGLVLIITPIFGLETSFLGLELVKLQVVFGAAVVLIFIETGSSIHRMLSGKLIVQTGLISYSIYLLHFPIIELARIKLNRQPTGVEFMFIFFFILLASYFSWKYVEMPFRTKNSNKGIYFERIFVPLFIFLLAAGLIGYFNQGFPENEGQPQYKKTSAVDLQLYIMGDSHASHLISGFDSLLSNRVKDLTANGCIPLIGVDRYDSRGKPGYCLETMSKYFDFVKKMTATKYY